jgi:hypothetical protein
MATISVYDINNYLKSNAAITALAGKTIDIFPAIGYADSSSPFIVYYFSPSIPSVESWWMRKDLIEYSIYDIDMDRMLNICEVMISLLSKGDEIASPGGVTGTSTRVLSAEFVGSFVQSPSERDGWYRMDLEFNIYHVKK